MSTDDTRPTPDEPAPAIEWPVRCQVCGAPHGADDPVLCHACGEPVLALGWAP